MQKYEDDHLKRLYSYLAECTVLLRSNGEFPLNIAGKIAAYGNGVRNTLKGGSGSGEVNCRRVINIEQGLQDAGFEITTYDWLNEYELKHQNAKKQFVKEIKKRAKTNHRPVLLEGLGAETGKVLADILLGRFIPSGKLTTTWAAWDDYPKLIEFGDRNDTRYREGIYVGYRYFDTTNQKALFPFGFGLSYTTFSWEIAEIEIIQSQVITRVKVKNTGTFSGKEVIQIYVSKPGIKYDCPYQELMAFAKTKELSPQEEVEMTIIFDMCNCVSYDSQNAAYVLEAGDYVLRVGTSSVDTISAAIVRNDKDIIVQQLKNALGSPSFEDWRPMDRGTCQIEDNIPVLILNADEIKRVKIEYEQINEIESVVEQMTNEELVYANVGAFHPGVGVQSIVGSASKTVAGAAGETTSVLRDKGFSNLVMADGPAGLRLSCEFYTDEKGVHSIGDDSIPEDVLEFAPRLIVFFSGLNAGNKEKNRKKYKVQEQYATALPIGTAIAQSFNEEFAFVCGDIVGEEMKRFGINLWLAPALNIHRSILCGRNFEYYSEDPFISGRMAASVTKGVQQHTGCGVVLKHYAANNQETNRYANNSLVSERAMREIYLRGFEICVKEAKPKGVMVSYNLLNGVHTAERRDLVEDILRSEFGFDGVVMTDWIVGGGLTSNKKDKYDAIKPHVAAAAGVNLYMPGSKKDFKDMIKGLKNKRLDRKQLQVNASRLYRICMMKGEQNVNHNK